MQPISDDTKINTDEISTYRCRQMRTDPYCRFSKCSIITVRNVSPDIGGLDAAVCVWHRPPGRSPRAEDRAGGNPVGWEPQAEQPAASLLPEKRREAWGHLPHRLLPHPHQMLQWDDHRIPCK